MGTVQMAEDEASTATIVPVPLANYTPKNHRKDQLEFVPDIRFFNLSNRAWHEYIGMLELWCDRLCANCFSDIMA